MTPEKETKTAEPGTSLRKHRFKQCNIDFKANKELSEHIEKVHIHDNWPESGSKRDLSMGMNIKCCRTQKEKDS